MAENKAPTPRQIDVLAAKFDNLRQKSKQQADKLDRPKEELIALANQWGKVTRRAKKSFRLDGFLWYILATYGQRTEVKRDAVQRLQLELVTIGRGRSFKDFFRPTVEYLATPGAAQAIKKLPRQHRRRFVGLYRACFELKPSAPSLDVKKQNGAQMARRVKKVAAAAA
jgi:hypothetical protein